MPHPRHRALLAASALLTCSLGGALFAQAANEGSVEAGRQSFAAQCAICHVAEQDDGGGGLGPVLAGLAGKAAGSNDTAFGYTEELRGSGLTWDAATLNRFLQNPTQVVPGTSMVIPVPDDRTRADIVAFLLSTQPLETAAVQPGAAGGGWRDDAPGTVRLVSAAELPAPNSAESVRNASQTVPRPEGVLPQTIPGFEVALYTDALSGPRTIRVAPNGDIFVAETPEGRIRVLRPGSDGTPQSMEVFAQGLERPFGIAFYPEAAPEWVYVGDGNMVKRFPYRVGEMTASGPAETIVEQLGATADGHWTRDIVFSADGSRMYVSVGSQSNVAEGLLEPKSPAEIAEWEGENGMGAAWGPEGDRATVQSFAPDGSDRQTFATGIRNCSGLSRGPAGDIFCSTNERDALGHDLVPDYLTRVQEGHFYGWPWYYMGDNEDPRHAGARPDLAGKVTVPDVLFQAHSASIHTAFYPQDAAGAAAFPEEFRGDAFVSLRGSWNRNPRTGYKIVRVMMENGVPTGEYQDFVTGFVVDDANVWARPYGVAVLQDGSLLFSENGNNTLWRVTYAGG